MALDVFISYSSKDLSVANQVKALIQRPNCRVFLAKYSLQAGSEISTGIIDAIRRCDLFILLWSENARSSEWVPQEIGIAKGLNKPIIPVVLHPSTKPSAFLVGTNVLPLYEDPAEALTWLQTNVFEQAAKQERTEGLAWLGLGAGVVWLLSQAKEPRHRKRRPSA